MQTGEVKWTANMVAESNRDVIADKLNSADALAAEVTRLREALTAIAGRFGCADADEMQSMARAALAVTK